MEKTPSITDGKKGLKSWLTGSRKRIAETLKVMRDNREHSHIVNNFSRKIQEGESLNEEETEIICHLPEKYLQKFLENLCDSLKDVKTIINLKYVIRESYEKDKIKQKNIENVGGKIIDYVEKNKKNYPKIYADIQNARFNFR